MATPFVNNRLMSARNRQKEVADNVRGSWAQPLPRTGGSLKALTDYTHQILACQE